MKQIPLSLSVKHFGYIARVVKYNPDLLGLAFAVIANARNTMLTGDYSDPDSEIQIFVRPELMEKVFERAGDNKEKYASRFNREIKLSLQAQLASMYTESTDEDLLQSIDYMIGVVAVFDAGSTLVENEWSSEGLEYILQFA